MTLSLNMKPKYIFLFVITLLLTSCGKDDGFGEAIPKETSKNYFPTSKGNRWNFDNQFYSQEDTTESKEILRFRDSIKENGTFSSRFTSDLPLSKRGVGTSLFTNGKLTKIEGRLIFNGDFIFQMPQLNQSIKIPLRNLIVLDQNISKDENLSTFNGTFQDTLAITDEKIPTVFNFSLDMDSGEEFESYSNGIDTYDDVLSSRLNLRLSAQGVLPNGIVLEILAEQDVLNTTYFFAKDIGMIFSTSTTTIAFEKLYDYSFFQMDPIKGNSVQVLEDYKVE